MVMVIKVRIVIIVILVVILRIAPMHIQGCQIRVVCFGVPVFKLEPLIVCQVKCKLFLNHILA